MLVASTSVVGFNYSRRQLLSNAAIAATRVGAHRSGSSGGARLIIEPSSSSVMTKDHFLRKAGIGGLIGRASGALLGSWSPSSCLSTHAA